MRREQFTPATSLNLLAASWIQFQTHDWFAHGREAEAHIEIPLPEGDDLVRATRCGSRRRRRTRRGSTATSDLPPTYINSQSHWWDASAIYGSSAAKRDAVRSRIDGKLVLKDGRLPLDPEAGVALTGFNENWWVGLGMLHTLFTLEHNAICDQLKKDHPAPDGRRAVRHGAADQLRAAREDPHRRMDARDHRAPRV